VSDEPPRLPDRGVHPKTPIARYASRTDILLGIVALVAALVFPWITGFRGTLPNIALFLGIYMILALGLNVVVGFTGLLDLGYVTFLATGAILTAFLLSLTRTSEGIDWAIGVSYDVAGDPVFGFDGGIFIVLLAAGLACALVGVLRGIPTLRVRGDYYAIVTLGFAEIVYETALWDDTNPLNFTRVTGGAFGIKLPSSHVPVLAGEKLYYDTPAFYYLVIGLVVVTFLLTHHLNRSRVGRALAAIRLDETAARACGVDVSKHKLVAFAVSGFLGGIGGGLYALWSGTVAVKGLDVWQSILILCGVVLGGMGSIRGTAVGIAGLMCLGEILREDLGGVSIPPEARFLIYGLLLIIVMRFRPQGILPPVRHGHAVTDDQHAALVAGEAPLYELGDREESAS
jgi:branched-chain amino acid transport system permease protein